MLFVHQISFPGTSSNVIAKKPYILGIKLLEPSFNHYFLQENASSILQLFVGFQPYFQIIRFGRRFAFKDYYYGYSSVYCQACLTPCCFWEALCSLFHFVCFLFIIVFFFNITFCDENVMYKQQPKRLLKYGKLQSNQILLDF